MKETATSHPPSPKRRFVLALSFGQSAALFGLAALCGASAAALLGAHMPELSPAIAAIEGLTRQGFIVIAYGLARACGYAAIGAGFVLPLWILTRLAAALWRGRRHRAGRGEDRPA